MNLFVSNIGYYSEERDISLLFKTYGEVISIKMILDKYTNRSRGYCFVEMNSPLAAHTAIENLNGFLFNGKHLIVREETSIDRSRF